MLFDSSNSYDYLKDKYNGDHMLWGWFAPYAMLIFAGTIVAVIACAIKFRMKRIPMVDLQLAIVIIVPIGIVVGSIFGKLGTSSQFNYRVYEYLFFWEPGMNLYGGMLGGTAAGFAFFWRKRSQRNISMWVYADCIVPNVLIAQSIGRWGNLFNHEIMGKIISVNKINWLPKWIWQRLFYYYDPSTGKEIDHVVFHAPLFLYESIATFVLFLLFTFILPNLGRWFSKKPWKFRKSAYPCIYNKDFHWANEDKVEMFPVQAPIKYRKNKQGQVSMSLWSVWNKAYFLREADFEASKNAQANIEAYHLKWKKFSDTKDAVTRKYKSSLLQAKVQLRSDKLKLKSTVKKLNLDYKTTIMELNPPAKNGFNYWWKTDSKSLYQLHNDNKYFVVHAGFLTGMYMMFYTLIRFVFETQREAYELSIRFSRVLDYLAYLALFGIGITMFVFAQFIAPKRWREEGWLYEKSY